MANFPDSVRQWVNLPVLLCKVNLALVSEIQAKPNLCRLTSTLFFPFSRNLACQYKPNPVLNQMTPPRCSSTCRVKDKTAKEYFTHGSNQSCMRGPCEEALYWIHLRCEVEKVSTSYPFLRPLLKF